MKKLIKLRLSSKILLLFLVTALIIIIMTQLSIGQRVKQHFRSSVFPHLYHYFSQLSTEIGTPPNPIIAQEISKRLDIAIVIQGKQVNWSSEKQPIPLETIQFYSQDQYTYALYRGRFIISIQQGIHQISFITRHSGSLSSRVWLLVSSLLGVLMVLTMMYFLLRWIISPLKPIRYGIKRIGSGELSHRIQIKRQDELGDLALDINVMADDIENMLAAKQQLLLAISHELRSPVTRAKVALSLMPDSAIKDGLAQDMHEIEHMITELLEAERFNQRHQVLNLSKVDINQLITEVIQYYHPPEEITILQQFDRHLVPQIIDRSRLQFVIKNLLDNAKKHRKQSTNSISIRTYQQHNYWYITVQDQGKGIPAKHIPHLTEPFYRVDPSRQRETGGYGLGLYLVKMIVEAHQGELKITSKENQGTNITLLFPLPLR
jgi:signal transduction histidine kinase